MSGAERMQKSRNRLWAAERALVLGREERNVIHEALSGNEDADLSAAFGPLFRALPKELLTKIVPAERTVMLCRVSKGARWALAAARPAASWTACSLVRRIIRNGS